MNITQKHYSFCAYRLPGADVVRLRRGVTRKGFHPGFVIAPFDMSGNVYTISDTEETSWSEISNILHTADFGVAEYPFPEVSTSKVEHADEVAGIKNFISGNHDKKVIASRIILKNDSIDIKRSFLNLERAYPQAFVFLFFSPETGGWIGASPELLLESNNSELSTYALAGTRPAGTDAVWD
ncbi:MAG: chorismate-binding protein, partial [Muribaculaceae bacterium]|nr:chorismate-binding protein [Muribaculaceae bacterium]